MGGDQIDVGVLDADPYVQRRSAHGGRVVGWVVALLDCSQLVGKRRHRVKGSRDRTPTRMVWAVPVSGAAVSMCQVPPTGSASSSGWSDVLKLRVVVVTDNYASRYGSDRHRVRGAYLHGPLDGRQCGTTRGHRAARPRWARRGVHRVGRWVCAHHRDRSHDPANNYLRRLTATKNLDIHSLSLGSA